MRNYRFLIRILFGFIVLVFFVSLTPGDIRSQYNVPKHASSGYACDLDLDGDNDIVIGHEVAWGSTGSSITILNNQSNAFFTISDTSQNFCGYQENIFAIDLNNDGYPDIVTFYANFSTGTKKNFIRVFYNFQGVFLSHKDFSLNNSSDFTDITYGDINGDGKIDLLVASNWGQLWGALYNDGNGNFSIPVYNHVTDTYPTGIACGDLNNDGRDDIVVFGSKVELYYSTPAGFQDTLLGEQLSNGRIRDFNHDGFNDIVSYSDLSLIGLTGVTMFENTMSGKLIRHEEKVFPFSTSAFEVADFNNDSLPDLLFQVDDNSGHIICHNNNDFHLADSQFVAVPSFGEWWRNCHCADLDGNGYIDILTIRNSSDQLPANIDIRYNDGKDNFVDHPLGIRNNNCSENIHIFRNSPNPFSDQTTIMFYLNKTSVVNISIYDANGDFISSLISGKISTGLHQVTWNRADIRNILCNPGIYFAVLKTPESGVRTIKLVTY